VNAYVRTGGAALSDQSSKPADGAGFKGSLFRRALALRMAPVGESSRLGLRATVLSGPPALSGSRRCRRPARYAQPGAVPTRGVTRHGFLAIAGRAVLTVLRRMLAASALPSRSIIATIQLRWARVDRIDRCRRTLSGRSGKRGLGAGPPVWQWWKAAAVTDPMRARLSRCGAPS